MTTPSTPFQQMEGLMAILNSASAEINRLEAEAKTLLHQLHDSAGYRDRMREKAILLSGLADEVAAVNDLPRRIEALAKERVGSFSYEAERALRVDSVFYMSVLLCPEDHRDGMPNELENLISLLGSGMPPSTEE